MNNWKKALAIILAIIHLSFWFVLLRQWEEVSNPKDFEPIGLAYTQFSTTDIDAYLQLSDFQLDKTTLFVDLYLRDNFVKITRGAEISIFDRYRWDFEKDNSIISAYFSRAHYPIPIEIGLPPARYYYDDIPIKPVGFGWYPFETYRADLFVDIEKWGDYGGDREYLYFPKTVVYNEVTGYKIEFQNHEIGSTFTIQQSQNRKSLYISVTTIFAAFLYTIFFISDFNSFIQATMALLLGLWGLKDIYLPSNLPEKFSGGSELILFYSYLLLGITIIFWVIGKTKLGKKS